MTQFVPAPKGRLVVRRKNIEITKDVPKPTVIVDTREQQPFTFTSLRNWIGGTVHAALPTGDYSLVGMEKLVSIERMTINDLPVILCHYRDRFFRLCERLAEFPHRAILIEGSYEEVNTPYHEYTQAYPNSISGSLDAIEAKYAIPIIYTSSIRELSERKAASWLSKTYTYWWLETNGYGRVLQDGDL